MAPHATRADLTALVERPGPPTGRLDLGGGALGALFRHGLNPGTTLHISGRNGSGVTTLGLALVADLSAGGAWCAAVGLPALGLGAAAHLGVDLARFALVDDPGPAGARVLATLVEGLDVVLTGEAVVTTPAVARALAARARRHRALVAVLAHHGGATASGKRSGTPDYVLEIGAACWEGLGAGSGHLARRVATVTLTGRRVHGPRSALRLWLPGPGGRVQVAPGPQRLHAPAAHMPAAGELRR